MQGDFVWIDLAAAELADANDFYQSVFSWKNENASSNYQTFHSTDKKPVSAIYEMPEFFKAQAMPSFWMSYIEVDDVYETAEHAYALGATVEIEQSTEYGKVALIRDPSGAGFTCYQGSAMKSTRSLIQGSKWVRSELFVSSIDQVKDFYEQLFHWKITPDPNMQDRYLVHNAAGVKISAIQVLDESLKGSMEYWAVFFGTLDLEKSKQDIVAAGGEVVYEYIGSDGKTNCLIHDSQGAFFFLTDLLIEPVVETEEILLGYDAPYYEAPESPTLEQSPLHFPPPEQATSAAMMPEPIVEYDHSVPPPPVTAALKRTYAPPKKEIKWKSALGLVAVLAALLTNSDFIWGFVVLAWVIPDLISGKTYFFDYLTRRRTPVMYWCVVLTWLAFSTGIFITSYSGAPDLYTALGLQNPMSLFTGL